MSGAEPGPSPVNLRAWLGDVDIYLFDQLLKGRITTGMRVLDAGCGDGRNLVSLFRIGCDVHGVDDSAASIAAARELAVSMAPELSAENFLVERVERLSATDSEFDAVIANALLHFALDESHFRSMLEELWRVLKPGGILFARLASSIGIEDRIQLVHGMRYRLPDGSERFLVDEGTLLTVTETMGGDLLEPIKTVNVQNQRCMTTWCIRKRARPKPQTKA